MDALPTFEVSASVDDDECLRLAVHGELDLWTAHRAAQRLDEERDGYDCLFLDLRQVTFAGAAAARFLLAAHVRAGMNGQRLVVIDGPVVHQVLSVTGLLRILDIVDPTVSV